jgi:hypothetical protein
MTKIFVLVQHVDHGFQSSEPDLDKDNEELSDYVKTRLLMARLLAMKKYQENQG